MLHFLTISIRVFSRCAWLLLFALLASSVQADESSSTKDKDPFAGKTVRNPRFGMDLIKSRSGNVPQVGQDAPDFSLLTSDGRSKLTLSSFERKQPVVLVFGSYT